MFNEEPRSDDVPFDTRKMTKKEESIELVRQQGWEEGFKQAIEMSQKEVLNFAHNLFDSEYDLCAGLARKLAKEINELTPHSYKRDWVHVNIKTKKKE